MCLIHKWFPEYLIYLSISLHRSLFEISFLSSDFHHLLAQGNIQNHIPSSQDLLQICMLGLFAWQHLQNFVSCMFRAAHTMYHLLLNVELPLVNRIFLKLELCTHASKLYVFSHIVYSFAVVGYLCFCLMKKGMTS